MPVPLTPDAIDRLRAGRLLDAAVPGLCIEMHANGEKCWRYRRQLDGRPAPIERSFGSFPANTLADARRWAGLLNAQIELGLDPEQHVPEDPTAAAMTVTQAHALYMAEVRIGRGSCIRRIPKPLTIVAKLRIFRRDIAPVLGNKAVHAVTEDDLFDLVEAKGRTAKVGANRLASELRVFFSWASSVRGRAVRLRADPARRLGELHHPEQARSRILSLQELRWLVQALSEEAAPVRKALLLCLLTAARIGEVVRAPTREILDGLWIIPPERTKNSHLHQIPLGRWARALIDVEGDWVIPAARSNGPRISGWDYALARVSRRMERIAGHPIAHFTAHDFRRTARSNTKRLGVDYETAEAMLNHVKRGLEQTYDRYELEDEKRDWFEKWEREIARIAFEAGVADALGVPIQILPAKLPESSCIEPG